MRGMLRRTYLGPFLVAYLFFYAAVSFVTAAQYPLVSVVSRLAEVIRANTPLNFRMTLWVVHWPSLVVGVGYSLVLLLAAFFLGCWIYPNPGKPAKP